MGEFADYAIDEAFVYEDMIWNYEHGNMSYQDAYECGVIDENGAVIDYWYGHSKSVTCRCCGQKGLFWGRHNGKWRLFFKKKLHECPKVPLPELRKELDQ